MVEKEYNEYVVSCMGPVSATRDRTQAALGPVLTKINRT
jgi:hypothetical protein